MAVPDYSEFQDAPGAGELAELARLADAQAVAERDVADLAASLAKAKDRVRDISEQRLPTLMDQLGMEEFRTTNGVTIKIKENLRASIAKERADEAHNWLDEHGHASLVKRMFAVSFGRSEEKWAKKFARDLAQRRRELQVVDVKKVEPSTLKAFVKAQLEEGVDLPLELFGVFRQRVAKIG